MNSALRLVSIALLLAAWFAGSHIVGPRLLPEPQTVRLAIAQEARFRRARLQSRRHAGARRRRRSPSRWRSVPRSDWRWAAFALFDQLADPWLVVLLNLPALVIIVLAYVWVGLNETAAIAAVALNKLPIATVTVREGARALDRTLDEMATVFRMGGVGAAAPRRPAAACALSRGSRALRPVAGLEDRADRRTAWSAERRRLRDRRRVPIIRRHRASWPMLWPSSL